MKRKFWRKKLMAMTVLMSLLLSATGCSEDPDAQTSSTKSSGSGDSWVIYWYLCGSDLESNAAAATTDLQEMLQVTLPENVKVVIQTGGAKKWQNDQVKADRLQRYEYSGNTLELKDEADQASMGDPATLKDFLKYGEENYQAGSQNAFVLEPRRRAVSAVSPLTRTTMRIL